ncbi:MAG: polymerase-3 subunit gamma/tau [Patescibacteria group bacterium]|nr:polymerase-3 subunit gamma/tau [Patescibacteria group bacterium]
MSGQALYRKYRSANFSELVGQEHVVTTLTSAIANGRLSHAYLFTGPRGTGKTSTARLLARALNCTSADQKPCNMCANCLAAINSSLDVVEIDAASNRSIDAVRDLREKVSLAPSQGKYKIYIIDEVHMLTTEAFNALLKTLEEPPAHAVFILATTEAHKLPETIISRTQRFNFKAIGMRDLVSHLTSIAKAEDIQTEPAALEIIAEASRGGFRDAISLLDQLAASGVSPITAETVRGLLGYSDAEEIATLSRAIAGGDAPAALTVLARLEAQGAQPGQVATQLATQWRAILLAGAKTAEPSEPVVQELAGSVAPARVAQIVEALLEITRSAWPQLSLEATVVRLAAPHEPAEPKPGARRIASVAPAAVKAPEQPAPAETPAPPAATAGNLQPELWPKVLVLIKSNNNSLGALLQMYPVDFGDGEVTIKPRFNFHRDLFLKGTNRTSIEAAATKVYGRAIRVHARTEDDGKSGARRKSTKPDPSAELVSSALEILGGEIVE